MNLVKIIESFIGNYGQQFYIGDKVSKCILSSKSKLNTDFMQQHIDRSGITFSDDSTKYIMFCTPTAIVETGDVVEIAGQLYQAGIVDFCYVGDIAIYKWVVLTKGGSLS